MSKLINITFVFLLLGNVAAAQLSVAPYIGDSMVVQRNKPVEVRGKAAPDSNVELHFAGNRVTAITGTDSCWSVKLPAMEASCENRSMKIVCDKETLCFNGILVGDVWMAAGQSNMAFKVRGLEASQRLQLSREADFNNIRYFYRANIVGGGKLLNSSDRPWESAKGKKIYEWSAIAYLFARDIYSELGVPVGIVNCSHGGSTAEAWISSEAFEKDGELTSAIGKNYDGLAGMHKNPSVLYDKMLKGLAGLNPSGVLWYQGESNGYFPDKYATMFTGLINDWRRFFDNEALPFIFAQLPSYRVPGDKSNELWARLRWAQYQVSRTVPHTAMVITSEYGDPANIHPINKQPVAKRFVDAAMATVYGNKQLWQIGLPSVAELNKGVVEVKFDNIPGGLTLSDNNAMVEVCGVDGVYHEGKCSVRKNVMYVKCDSVRTPVKVRYAWKNINTLSVYYKGVIPVLPFELEVKP